MKFTFKVKSSSGEPYTVEFLHEKNKVFVFCDCPAGIFGKLCKHKTELLAGDKDRLFDELQGQKLDEVNKIVRSSSEMGNLSKQIVDQEKIIKSEQAKMKKAKKDLEVALRNGFQVDF